MIGFGLFVAITSLVNNEYSKTITDDNVRCTKTKKAEMSRFQSIYDSQETEAQHPRSCLAKSQIESRLSLCLRNCLKTSKTYFQYLKGLFCSFPWLDIENEDFKREVKELVGENPCKFRSMCSFASQKFTQMRNQLRRMLFHSTMDIQALSLDGLCNYLYRPFTPPGESPVDKKRRKMTRAFLSTKKFNECEKFWAEFKEFYASIKEDIRPNIWDLLQEKEERRIKRYQDEQEREK
uniref:Uncharacterized protein n=1 Tax=Magallana gigas TaxID=29159 RepID=A0A8W8P0I4_MAGGI